MPVKDLDGKVAFSVGTGRCGTKFIYELMRHTPGVSSTHERHPLNDIFHRYCKWYKLPVDDRGFLTVKKQAILEDLESHRFSFEASAHLSISIPELYKEFGAKFIFMVRSPKAVVESYYRKGWYQSPILRNKTSLAPGINVPNPLPADLGHAWGRILPLDDVGHEWNALTRVGKLAWYWASLNQSIINFLKEIPESHYMIVKLEAFNFAVYRKVLEFFELDDGLTREGFEQIANARPNKSQNRLVSVVWSENEVTEFLRFVKPLASDIGYELSNTLGSQRSGFEKKAAVSNTSILQSLAERLRTGYSRFIMTEFRKRHYKL